MSVKPFPEFGDSYSSPYSSASRAASSKDPGARRGCGCFQIAIVSLITVAVLTVASCVFGFFYLKRSMITSGDRQEELARELVDWEFNDRLPTQFAFDSFFGRMVVKGEEDAGFVVLIQPGSIFMDLKTGQKLNDDQWGFSFGEQDEGESTVVVVEGERKIELGPYELDLTFNQARGTKNGETFWEVLGVFPGRRGPCIGALQLRDSAWTDEAIEKAIQSIRLPSGEEK